MQHSLGLKGLLLLIAFPLYSQKLPPSFDDSIRVVIRKQSGYEEKVDIYRATIEKVLQVDQELARTYIEALRNMASMQKDTAIIAFCYEKEASLFYISGDYESAGALFNKACTAYEKAGQLSASLLACTKTGIMHNLSGQYQKAGQIYQKQLLRSQQARQLESEAYICNQLGALYHYQGLTDSALFYYQLSTELFSAVGDTTEMLRPMSNIAILLEPVNPDSSLVVLQKIYQLREQYGKPIDLVNTLISYGGLLRRQGLYIDAFNHYKKAYWICKKNGYQNVLPAVLDGLHDLKAATGEYDEALRYLDEAISIIKASRSVDHYLPLLISKAATLHKMRRFEEGIAVIDTAIELSESTGGSRFDVRLLTSKAISLVEINRNEAAREALGEADVLLRKGRNQEDKLFFEEIMALWLVRNSQPRKAVELASPIYKYYLSEQRYKEAFDVLNTLIDAYHAIEEPSYAVQLVKDYRWLSDTLQSRRLERDLKIQTQEFEFRLKEKQSKLEQQRRVAKLEVISSRNQAFAVFASLLSAIGAVFVYFVNRQRQLIRVQRDELQHQAASLREIDENKTRFFINVAHELRTPITLIKAPLDQVAKMADSLSVPVKDAINLARANTDTLLKLINALLKLPEVTASRSPTMREPCDIISLMEIWIDSFKPLARQKEQGLILEYTQEEWDKPILTDPEKLERIVYNLVVNAIKFTPKAGRITIRLLKKEEDKLVIEVKDNGEGIAKGDLGNIFDRFYQAKSQQEGAHASGTGIGLAICKEFTEAMGGRITVDSALGKGAVFQVELPLLWASQPLRAKQPLDIPGNSITSPSHLLETSRLAVSPKPRVLIAEDHQQLLAYLKSILQHKYEVLTATNGREALDQLKVNTPVSAIVTDYMMPFMDGLKFLEIIKEDHHYSKIPCILLTARAAEKDKIAALRLGINDYMDKPFSVEELQVRLEVLISRRRAALQAVQTDGEELMEGEYRWLENMEQTAIEALKKGEASVAKLAKSVSLSSRQLERRLKHLTGLTPSEYLREIRLNMARTALENGDVDSVEKAAAVAGFKSHAYFSRLFRDRFGKSPSDYLV